MANIDDQSGTQQQEPWEPCAGGEISQMVKRLNSVERRQRVRQLASTGLLSMALFAVGAIVIGGFVVYQEPQFGGIGCTECLSHAAEYRDHVTGVTLMADLQLADKIAIHFQKCKCCRMKFNEAYPDVTLAAIGSENLLLPANRLAFSLASTIPRY